MKESGLGNDQIGQNLIKSIGNICFSAFVFSVLIFTVIAITYQPPDPWLESAPTLTRLFIETRNATFRNDNSVLNTGEDFALPPGIVLLTTSPMALAITITESSIESAERRIGNCTGKDGLVCDEMADGQTIHIQQRAERDVAIARLEQSRIILAMRLAEHHGKKHRVIEESLAFVGNVGETSRFVSHDARFSCANGPSGQSLIIRPSN